MKNIKLEICIWLDKSKLKGQKKSGKSQRFKASNVEYYCLHSCKEGLIIQPTFYFFQIGMKQTDKLFCESCKSECILR